MKAKIDKHGVLRIIPEDEMEEFALNIWWDDHLKKQNDSSHEGFAVLALGSFNPDYPQVALK